MVFKSRWMCWMFGLLVMLSAGCGEDSVDSGQDRRPEPVVCQADQRVKANQCVACPAGATRAPGDDASGADTQCQATVTLCGQDEYVQASQCVACPAGTTRDAGDDASGADTSCDAETCTLNQRVEANQCVACPAGTTKAPGDDASGADTQCEATLCGQDEVVLANQCVACPAGTTKAPGDDASGADTTCDDACSLALGVTCAQLNQAYLKASNTDKDDFFGYSVALEGDTLVVGAFLEDSRATGVGGDQLDNSVPDTGAVYVFERSGDSWSQAAYLKASNTGSSDQFGWSVALDGDTLAVGAPGEDSRATGVGGDQLDDSASNSGAAYVFERSGGSWSQAAYLKASKNDGGPDEFGHSVALEGDTLVVGARRDQSGATGVNGDQLGTFAISSGAAYVFERSGGSWSQAAYLKASNTDVYAFFGHSVALEGNTLAVGALGEDSGATGVGGNQLDDSAPDSGAVYVFERSGGSWSQAAYLKASNTGSTDQFGWNVTLDGDTLAVGAPGEASSATGVGGNQLDNSADLSGAVYVFERSGGSWSQTAYLKASNTGSTDQFGYSVALDGDTLAVGALGEDSRATGVGGDQLDNSAATSGAVYVFERSGGSWRQAAYLKTSHTGSNDVLGWSMAMEGDTLVVGAPGEASGATGVGGDQLDDSAVSSGAAYVYKVKP